MITTADLHWLSPEQAAPWRNRMLACPVCSAVTAGDAVLQVPSLSAPHPQLTLMRCAGCGSLHYDPPGISDFSDLGQNQEDFWRFYAEVGGGVWETIWPVIAEGGGGRRTLLDVGCGFGFALDFWKRMTGGEAIGVELADYGRVGADALGVPMHHELLQDCAPLAGRRFDIVYASEVIEHVPDPAAFAALLAAHVADDGVLVLTTPCARHIEPANHSPSLLASLAPGFHGFLLSAEAFAECARACGFAHVDVRSFGERQVLWASRRPLRVEPERPELFSLYLDYVARRLPTLAASSAVWQGYAYRRVRDLVSVGRVAEAAVTSTELLAALEAQYGPDIGDPVAVLARLEDCRTVTEFGRAVPYFLPCLYHWLGALAQHHQRDPERALRFYRGAVDCTLEVVRLGSTFFLEAISLVWPSRARQAELLLARGDIAAGVDMFVEMADCGDDSSPRNGFAVVPIELLETTIPQLCEQIGAAGYRDDAQRLADAYIRYVERRYGAAARSASAIEAALREQRPGLPRDPLHALYLSARQRAPAAQAVADLRDVVRIGDAHAGDPNHGQRMRETADRARRLLQSAAALVPPRPAAWSFDMTYTLKGPE